MANESEDIERWGTTTTVRTRDDIAKQNVVENERNRLWWETLPMTYVDWESSNRDPQTAEDFAQVDGYYFHTNPYIGENVPFENLAGAKVLEIGCGAGSAACRFAQCGASVTAVDITDKAIDLTQRHAAASKVIVQSFQADAEDLSVVEDNAYDYLYSWGVMHHSARPDRCFSEAFKKLKPGGSGLVMVYHRDSLRYWLKGLIWLVLKGKAFKGEGFEAVQRHYTDGYYHKHYSRSELAQAMQASGFRVDAIEVTHMGSRMIPFIPEPLRKTLKRSVGWLLVAKVSKL